MTSQLALVLKQAFGRSGYRFTHMEHWISISKCRYMHMNYLNSNHTCRYTHVEYMNSNYECRYTHVAYTNSNYKCRCTHMNYLKSNFKCRYTHFGYMNDNFRCTLDVDVLRPPGFRAIAASYSGTMWWVFLLSLLRWLVDVVEALAIKFNKVRGKKKSPRAVLLEQMSKNVASAYNIGDGAQETGVQFDDVQVCLVGCSCMLWRAGDRRAI